jgi:hypothetical protein
MAITATYVSATTFTVSGTQTNVLLVDRRVNANCGVDGVKYGTIINSSPGAGITTIVLSTASDDLTSNLTEIEYGIVGSGPTQSLPVHSHNNTEGRGGQIDHVSLDNIGSTTHSNIDLHVNDNTKHRVINDAGTTDTDLWSAVKIEDRVTTATGSLTTDHGSLTGLTDDDHLHYSLVDGTRAFTGTIGGVAPVANTDLTTKLYVDTEIGSLTTDHGELTGLTDDDHLHYHTDGRGDIRYYTKTLLDAGQLDTRYYTETELDGGQLDNRYYTETELDAGQLDNRYYTESEVDTISGALDTTKADVVHTHTESDVTDLDKYTQAEVTTISGNIVTQIITDHGNLTGRDDDDHTLYSLADGTRAFTGTVAGVTPTVNAHLATKGYVDTLGAGHVVTSSLTAIDSATVSGGKAVIWVDAGSKWTSESADMKSHTPQGVYDGTNVVLFGECTISGLAPETLYFADLDGNLTSTYEDSPYKIQIGRTTTSGNLIVDIDRGIEITNRAVFAGGSTGTYSNIIDYREVVVQATTFDFGDLTAAKNRMGGAADNGSSNRAVFAGGEETGPTIVGTIDYINMAVLSNANVFGQLTVARNNIFKGAVSNKQNQIGLFAGGNTGAVVNVIDYITLNNLSSASDHGDLNSPTHVGGATSNGVNDRAVFAGGYGTGYTSAIDYTTISTLQNATAFGLLTVARSYPAGLSNSTDERGVFAGGYKASGNVDVSDYVTISVPSAAIDFGDLSAPRYDCAATSNGTGNKGLIAGGYETGPVSTIDLLTINSVGNAQNWGDLTVARAGLTSAGDAN